MQCAIAIYFFKFTPITPAINVDIATGTKKLLKGIYPVPDITNTVKAVKQFKTMIITNGETFNLFTL